MEKLGHHVKNFGYLRFTKHYFKVGSKACTKGESSAVHWCQLWNSGPSRNRSFACLSFSEDLGVMTRKSLAGVKIAGSNCVTTRNRHTWIKQSCLTYITTLTQNQSQACLSFWGGRWLLGQPFRSTAVRETFFHCELLKSFSIYTS